MFEKMCQVDPSAPTAEEIQLGGVTKPRYMVWRETISSTAAFGFRIEGIRKHDGTSSKDYKTVGTAPQILTVFDEFIKDCPHALVIHRPSIFPFDIFHHLSFSLSPDSSNTSSGLNSWKRRWPPPNSSLVTRSVTYDIKISLDIYNNS